MDGSDPQAVPFERLSGGPRQAGGREDGKLQQLLARLVLARARVGGTLKAVAAAASGSGGGGGGSGGALGRALLKEEGGGGESDSGEIAAASAPRPKPFSPPPPAPAPAARLKALFGERVVQQLEHAIGDAAAKAGPAAATATAAATPATLASAARSHGRELLPERVAALMTRASDDAPPLAFVCPLTAELMADPVVAPDGFSYERAAIAAHYSKKGGPILSPMTGETLALSGRGKERGVALVPNRVLASMILEWGERAGRRGGRVAARGGSGAGGVEAAP